MSAFGLDALLAEAASLAPTPRSASSSPASVPAPPRMGGVVGALIPPPGTLASKLYPVVTVSGVDRRVCFGIVGAGSASFCIREGCTVKSHMEFKTGFGGVEEERVFICRKVNNLVFSQPSIARNTIPDEVWKEWMAKSDSLPGWVRLFDAVEITDDSLATMSDVKIQTRKLRNVADVFKTPAKRKREMVLGEPLADWTFAGHSRVLPMDDSEELEGIIATGMGKGILTKIVGKLETTAITLGEAVEEVAVLSHNRFLANEEGVNLLSGIVQNLKSSVGVAAELDDKFEAPTLWGATAFIADEVSRLGSSVLGFNDEISSIQSSLDEVSNLAKRKEITSQEDADKMLGVLRQVIERVKSIAPELTNLGKRVAGLEEKAKGHMPIRGRAAGSDSGRGGSASSKGDAMDDLMMMLGDNVLEEDATEVRPSKSPRGVDSFDSLEAVSHVIGELERNVGTLLGEVGILKATAEEKTVKFGNLGLKDIKQCRVWMEKKFEGYRYGLIMDPLLMLDRIFGSDDADADSQFKALVSRVHLKVKTGAEAAAIKALHFKRPRLFHSGGTSMNSERNKSKLNKLPNFEAWQGGGEGVSNYILRQMNFIHGTVSNDIHDTFGSDHAVGSALTIAINSLNATTTFITQLLGFIDTIYGKLHRYSKFTAEQAWSLTTQILDRICEDLYAPKIGATSSMTIEEPSSVCSHVLWSCFQTHDVMAKYISHNFENHPAISAEYVKFLATNSGFDKVEKLEGVVTAINDKVTKAVAESSSAMKKADGVGSKCGIIEGLLTTLSKRVKSLEDHKGK